MSRSQIIRFLTVASGLTFSLLYFYHAAHNTLRADDFHFLDNVINYGVWDGMIQEYHTWSSRYISVLVNHSFLWIEQETSLGLLSFSLLSLLLLFASLSTLIHSIPSRTDLFHSSDFMGRLSLAAMIGGIIFYATPDRGETWFWLCSACTYLWSIIATFFAAAWLLNRKSNASLTVIGLLACLYIGGSSGPLALLWLFTLTVLIIKRLKETPSEWNWSYISAWSILCISFYFLYRAEGNSHREAFFDDITVFESFWLNFKMCGILVLKILKWHFIGVSFILLVMTVTSPFGRRGFNDLIRRAIRPTILLAVGIFLYQWPVTYKMQDIIATRALLPIVLLLLVYLIILYNENRHLIDPKILKHLPILIPAISWMVGIFMLIKVIL